MGVDHWFLEWPDAISIPLNPEKFSRLSTENPVDVATLAQAGIEIVQSGSENWVYLDPDGRSPNKHLQLFMSGCRNTIVIGRDCNCSGRLIFESSSFSYLGGNQHTAHLDVNLYSGGSFFWGLGSRTYGCRAWAHGGCMIVVGDDCLLSENIQIRSSDHHSIIDLCNLKQINHPKNVLIGRHVWIGGGVSINKGVSIGQGSIIASNTVISVDVPERQIWGGIPARKIREEVSWVDSHPANPEEIADLRRILGTT